MSWPSVCAEARHCVRLDPHGRLPSVPCARSCGNACQWWQSVLANGEPFCRATPSPSSAWPCPPPWAAGRTWTGTMRCHAPTSDATCAPRRIAFPRKVWFVRTCTWRVRPDSLPLCRTPLLASVCCWARRAACLALRCIHILRRMCQTPYSMTKSGIACARRIHGMLVSKILPLVRVAPATACCFALVVA